MPEQKTGLFGALRRGFARLLGKLCALIPHRVSNNGVIRVFELLRKRLPLAKRSFPANLRWNQESVLLHTEAMEKNRGFVEDQNRYTDMAYGKTTMQYAGCEIFAVFNALWTLVGSRRTSLPRLIAEFEKDGMVLSGKFGTAPRALADFFRREGFPVEMTTRESEFDALGEKSDSLILTMFNDRDDIRREVHTVNLSRENGLFTAHNVYGNGWVVGPCASVSELIAAIHGGKARGISLIGIRKKDAQG